MSGFILMYPKSNPINCDAVPIIINFFPLLQPIQPTSQTGQLSNRF